MGKMIGEKWYNNPAMGEAMEKSKVAKKAESSKEKPEEDTKGGDFKVSVQKHEDGSYTTHGVDEDGKKSKMDHEDFKSAVSHMKEHFGEEDMDEGDDQEDEGGDDASSYDSHGVGDSIKSLLS